MSAWAAKGVKCVCIKRDRWEVLQYDPLDAVRPKPAYNEVCVITDVVTDICGDWLLLKGYDQAHHWHASCFRPLTKQEEDLATFSVIASDAQNSIHVSEPEVVS